MSTSTISRHETSQREELDPGRCAHIVRTYGDESAAAMVLAARIEGTPLTALCGHIFVPERDPKSLPVCPPCKEVYDLMRMMNEDLRETPES